MVQISTLRLLNRNSFFVSLLWLEYSSAQSGPGVIQIPTIHTQPCDGKAGVGSATWSSVFATNTGDSLNVYPSAAASQAGAYWSFWTDNTQIKWSDISVPGSGTPSDSGPKSDLDKLLKINPDERSFAFNITSNPYPAITASLWTQQIDIEVGLDNGKSSVITNEIPGLTNDKTTVQPRTSIFTSRPAATNYPVTASGVWSCSNGAGIVHLPPVDTASPEVSSQCVGNAVPTNTEAYAAYGVSSYLSGLIASQTNSPSQPTIFAGVALKSPNINIKDLLAKDVALPGCSFDTHCDPIECSVVRGSSPEDQQNPARFLAYSSYLNLNNLIWQLYEALFKANVQEINIQGDLVKTFFTTTPPELLWNRITGAIAPGLSLLSTILGIFKSVFAPEVILVDTLSGGILYLAGGVASATPAVSLEEKFDANAAVGQAISGYLNNMTQSLSLLYDNLITNVVASKWQNVSDSGSLLSNFNDIQNLQQHIADNVTSVFEMKAINALYQQDNVFIIWIPFGGPLSETNPGKGGGGIGSGPPVPVVAWHTDNFTPQICADRYQKDDNGASFTVCGAGFKTPGMARIYQITDKIKTNTYRTSIQGWNSGYQVTGWKFDLPSVIRGSVNSWQQGGLNYNLDSLSGDDVANLVANFASGPEQSGIFTLPVCSPGNIGAAIPGVSNGPTDFWADQLFHRCTLSTVFGGTDNANFVASLQTQELKDAIMNGLPG